jgi:hypothetical protein
MGSWVEKIGGGTAPRTDNSLPQDDQAVPQDGAAVPQDGAAEPAEDESVPQDGGAEPDEDESVPRDGEAVPGGGEAVPGGQAVAADDEAVPAGDDQVALADDLVVIVAEDDHDPTAAADDEGTAADGDSEPDPTLVPAGAVAAAESPTTFAADDADDAAKGEAGQPRANAAPLDAPTGVRLASGPAPRLGAGTGGAGRWPEIQAMFVDDPRASVELAASLADDTLEAFVATVKDRQRSLRSTWSGSNADTEQLRLALQRYRSFWRHLHSLSIDS